MGENEQTGLRTGSEHFKNLISPIREGEGNNSGSVFHPDAGLGPFHKVEEGNKKEVKAAFDDFLAEDAFKEYMIPLISAYVSNRSQGEQYIEALYGKLKKEVFDSEEINTLSGESLKGKIWEILYYVSKEDLKLEGFDFSKEDENAGDILDHLRDFLRPENQRMEFKIEGGKLSEQKVENNGNTAEDTRFKELLDNIQESIASTRKKYEDVKALLSPEEDKEFSEIFVRWDNSINEISKDPNPEYFEETKDANDEFIKDSELILQKVAERLTDAILFSKIKSFIDKNIEDEKRDVFDEPVLEDFLLHLKQSEQGQVIAEYVKNTKLNDFDSEPIFSSRYEKQFADVINEQIKLQLEAMEAGQQPSEEESVDKIDAVQESSQNTNAAKAAEVVVVEGSEVQEMEAVAQVAEAGVDKTQNIGDENILDAAPIEEQRREKEQWELDIEKIRDSIVVISKEEFDKFYSEKDLFLHGDCRELLNDHIKDILEGHGDKETLPRKIREIFELSKDKHAKQELIVIENGNTYLVEKHAREKEKVRISDAEKEVLLKDAEQYLINFESKEANKGAIEHFTGKIRKDFLGLIMWQYLKNNIVTHYGCSDEQAQDIAIEIITGQK
jgi:hypothetical protein